jgi:asparagine synthase (glutamine-hydrolysing)
MCGIIGYIDKKQQLSFLEKRQIAEKMLDRITHRGGDSSACIIEGDVVIGQTRLSILDSTINASQPLCNLDLLLSYNGEIYNHLTLREKYLTDCTFGSHSDTLTLFELLNKYDLNGIYKDIWGMFAFSAYYKQRKEVLLVTDSFGIKPLYYLENEDWFAWSSEPKVFKDLPGVQFELNENTLFEQLVFRYVYGEETLFKNVFKIMPAQSVVYNLIENKIYNCKFSCTSIPTNDGSLAEVLAKSVKDHLVSDTLPGIQLSGGVDSSLVAYYANKSSGKKMHTFSIGMNNREWNEFEYSDKISEQLATQHHKIVFDKLDFIKNFDLVTYHLDFPIVHPNTVPLYLLALEARKFTKVLLTGEGADELFLGYRRYANNFQDVLYSNAFTEPDNIKKILKKKIRTDLFHRKHIVSQLSGSLLEQKGQYDIKTYLPHLLQRQDAAGMAANIECRVPFLYPTVYELSKLMKQEEKLSSLNGKDCLKKLALKFFPKNIILRKKCGFGLPIHNWLLENDALALDVENLKTNSFILKYFDANEIMKIIEENTKGIDHSGILFTLVSFCRWYNIFIH